MMRRWLLWLLCLGVVSAEELRVIQLTDIHASGPHFSAVAFSQACREGLATHPEVLMLTGDHGDNSYDTSGFYRRFQSALGQWKKPLQDYSGALVFAVGNDDLAHNYQTQPADLAATYQAFRVAFGERYYLDELGNGVAPRKVAGITWISLNSVVFSPLNQTPEVEQQSRQTFAFLRRELARAGGPVVVLSHIAPCWDLMTSHPGWRPEALQELTQILREHPGQVTFCCGHHHRNHVQGLRPERPVAVLTSGALATKYGYQPNWRDYRWQVEGTRITRVQFTLHYPGKRNWERSQTLEPDRLQDYLDRLQGDSDFCRDYIVDIFGHHRKSKTWSQEPDIRTRVLRQFWVTPEDATK